jgi:hypothetical protein
LREVYRSGRREEIRQVEAGVRFATSEHRDSTGFWRSAEELGRVEFL